AELQPVAARLVAAARRQGPRPPRAVHGGRAQARRHRPQQRQARGGGEGRGPMGPLTRKTGKKGRVTLPRDLADVGVASERKGDSLVVRKTRERPRRKYQLRDLLAQITPENVHPETDWGRPVGKEVV